MKSYSPTLQSRNKWKAVQKKLAVGNLVFVGDAAGLSQGGGAYRLSRIRWPHPQTRKGKQLARRATVTVMGKSFRSGYHPNRVRASRPFHNCSGITYM